jgi:hypothetical protein
MNHNINITYKCVNILADNMGENHWNLRPGEEFLCMTPKAQSIKEKYL